LIVVVVGCVYGSKDLVQVQILFGFIVVVVAVVVVGCVYGNKDFVQVRFLALLS